MRGPTSLLKGAWEIFTTNPKLFAGIYLVPMLITFVWSAYMATKGETLFMSATELMLAGIFMVIIFIVNVLMGVAMIKAIDDPVGSTVRGVYSDAKEYFWSYVWLAILVGVTVALGFMLLIIPGIIFAIWFAFSYFALLFEDKRGTEAMKTSKGYVDGNWWAVFGRYAFLVLVAIAASIVIGIITTPFEAMLGRSFASLIPLLFNIVLIPVAIGYSYLMYKELKSESEVSSAPEEDPTVQEIPAV